jgi:hypothetical protein
MVQVEVPTARDILFGNLIKDILIKVSLNQMNRSYKISFWKKYISDIEGGSEDR